jgi:hypothetical protein
MKAVYQQVYPGLLEMPESHLFRRHPEIRGYLTAFRCAILQQLRRPRLPG